MTDLQMLTRSTPVVREIQFPQRSIRWGTSDLMQASVDHRINQDWKLYAAYSRSKIDEADFESCQTHHPPSLALRDGEPRLRVSEAAATP